MSKQIDKKILTLQQKIQTQKEEIEKIESGKYKTNGVWMYPGSPDPTSITISKDQETLDLIEHYINFFIDGKILKTYLGYPLEFWKNDITVRKQKLSIQTKKEALRQYETALESLLSHEAKAEKIIADIELKLQ